MKTYLAEVKTAITTAVATMGTGFATIIDLIPDGIGKLASLVGVILTLIIIYVQISMYKSRKDNIDLENKKLQLEVKKLKDSR